EVARTTQGGLARGVPLVVELHRKPESLAGRGEATDPHGLVPVLAAKRQGQTDDQLSDLLVARDLAEGRKGRGVAPARERAQGTDQAVAVVADGEPDRAVANVEREITHGYGEPDDTALVTSIVIRESSTGSRGHQAGHASMRTSSNPESRAIFPTSSYARPASAAVICGRGRVDCCARARTLQCTPSSATEAGITTSTTALSRTRSIPGWISVASLLTAVAFGSVSSTV